MNLHNIVAGAIGAVNAHEQIKLWRCTGISVNKGVVTPLYEAEDKRAQIQAPNASDLQLNERVAKATHAIKVWMDAPATTINRVEQSAGDIIQRADGTYWLIVGTKDDYSPEGWLCCFAVLQTNPPEGVDADESGE